MAVVFSLLLLTASVCRAAPDDSPLQAPEAGLLELRSLSGAAATPAIMHSSEVHFEISGMVAVVTLRQRFRNDSSDWVEGVYSFPLPDSAAVRHLEMQLGERLIVGEIKERQAASVLYQQARDAGKKASLVAQQRPNMFSNHIANIAPGEEISIRLEYVQPAQYSGGEFSLRFPMTITPRYMPGEALPDDDLAAPELSLQPGLRGWARATDQVPDAPLISPFLSPGLPLELAAELSPERFELSAPHNPIKITAQLDAGMPLARVEARYHELALQRDGSRYQLRLAHGVSEMDRDFVLSWSPVTGASPRAALFTEVVEGEYYGLLMMLPPDVASSDASPVPREVIFVIDTSGSMGGVAINQARASLALALSQLNPGDFFNIIEFNSTHRQLYPQARPANRHYLQRAQEFVRQLAASGGTEMLPALRQALAPAVAGGEDATSRLRQLIFITDGAVGNEVALFEEINSRLGASRLFTVGIGSAPNSWFMRKAAAAGRGTYTHIGKLEEVASEMGRLFDLISAPVVTDVAVDWPVPVAAWPQRVPDLYRGKPVVQSVHFGKQAPSGVLTVSGQVAGEQWSRQLPTNAEPDRAASGRQHAGVASLWARKKIETLLDQLRRGELEQNIRGQVLEVALTHKLLSPYTSFIAIEQVQSRPDGNSVHTRAIPNSRPLGQSPQPYAYPSTATTGPAKAFLGLLLLFTALMVHVVRQPEADRTLGDEA